MDALHHKPIKKFGIDGIIYDDSTIMKMRVQYTDLLLKQMYSAGYVERIDIEHDFTLVFNDKGNFYNFELSIYAVYVGKRKVEWITGIDGTQVVYTQKNRSSAYSSEAA